MKISPITYVNQALWALHKTTFEACDHADTAYPMQFSTARVLECAYILGAKRTLSLEAVQRVGRKWKDDGKWAESELHVEYYLGTFTIIRITKPKEIPGVPSWFQPPRARPINRSIWRRTPEHHRTRMETTVQAIIDGYFVLPPWQRDEVWGEDRRLMLLDSIMQHLPFGIIIAWIPPYGLKLQTRPFPGTELRNNVPIIIDGQQRLTTLLRAARGDVQYYWDGEHWNRERGHISAEFMRRAYHEDELWLLRRSMRVDETCDNETIRVWYHDLELLRDTEVHFLTLRNFTIPDMVETYRRLATYGLPHNETDLSVMEKWIRENSLA